MNRNDNLTTFSVLAIIALLMLLSIWALMAFGTNPAIPGK